jgi:hypothetical protein
MTAFLLGFGIFDGLQFQEANYKIAIGYDLELIPSLKSPIAGPTLGYGDYQTTISEFN